MDVSGKVKTVLEAKLHLETIEFEDLSPEMQEQVSEVDCDWEIKKKNDDYIGVNDDRRVIVESGQLNQDKRQRQRF